MYARKLTKEELVKTGITEVTKDGHVFKGEDEILPTVTKQGYLIHVIYDFDENGNKIKVPNENSVFGYNYKQRSVGLHRLMWAWFYDEVPEGMIVDHINNKHQDLEDHHLDNLQCITQGENIAKERSYWNVREIKCNLKKPRSFYQDKLEGYILAYEQAKENKDAKGAHALRANIAQTRARLRYYDSHILEALEVKRVKEEEEARKREYHERADKRRELQAEVDSARKFYKELENAYGKNDDTVKQYWLEWKLAIIRLQKFKAETARAQK